MQRDQWQEAVPGIVAAAAERWDLQVGEPYSPGGQCSWVAPCTRGTDELVLKVGWPHPESRDEARGLREWAGDGTVLLHESAGDVLLLERLGGSLEDAPQDEQDVVVAGLLRRLWREPVGEFRPLSEMCDQWAAGADPPLDPGIARAGLELWHELGRTGPQVLLATDLHSGNVLRGEREPWLVIDPKPYVGDPHYDVLQCFFFRDWLVEDPEPPVRRMAELCDLDPERVRLWAFARAVVECDGQPALQRLAMLLAP